MSDTAVPTPSLAYTLPGSGDRDPLWPFGLAVVVAAALHVGAGFSGTVRPEKKTSERIEMAVYKPPPPPPKIEEPPPPKEEPPPPPPKKEALPPPPSNQTPPEPPPPDAPPPPIVTGISLASTVQGNSGFEVRVGNTTFGDPNKEKFVAPSDVKAYAGGNPDFQAARASTLSREARVLRDFKGPYPKDLAEDGVEGAVVLLVEISKAGSIREVTLAKSSGNSTLDKLAREYVKRFQFQAAVGADGEAVDSLLRYTYRFELVD